MSRKHNASMLYGGDGKIYATTQSGTTYTLSAADVGSVVEFTSASAVTITVPTASGYTGAMIEVFQYGTGQLTLVAGSGVTLRTASSLTSRAQYSIIGLRYRTAAEVIVSGDLT